MFGAHSQHPVGSAPLLRFIREKLGDSKRSGGDAKDLLMGASLHR